MSSHSPATGRRRESWRALACLVIVIVLSACEELVLPSSGPTFAILHAPSEEPCMLAGAFDVTFRIDPDAAEPVTVVSDEGVPWHVHWAQGFVAGTAEDPVVRDPLGMVVARDGQRLMVPAEGFPKLPGGWPVCFGDGSIWVQRYALP